MATPKSAGTKKAATKPANTGAKKELKTEFPLSEKDEIKRAEENMSKAAKKANN